MRIALVLLLTVLTHHASGNDLIRALDSLCLPSGYACEVLIQIDGTETVPGTREARVSVASHWARVEYAQVIEGVGKSLVEVRMGADGETWVLNPASLTVRRSGDFAQRRIIAGESDFSPIGVVRALRAALERGSESTSRSQPGGVVTYRVVVTHQSLSAPVEVDIQDGRITAYRASFVAGRFYSQTVYDEWIELADGSCVPTRVVSESFNSGTGDPAIRNTVLIRDICPLPAPATAPSFRIPPEYTVIDEIDGVTKKSDGTVIAPIEYPDDRSSRPGLRGTQTAMNTFLLASGVAIVILAGLIWRAKSRSGS